MSEKSSPVRREVVVANRLGLHARPAAIIARAVSGSSSEVWFIRENGEKVLAASALSILMMAAVSGTRLIIEADGEDALQIVDELESAFVSRFGEAE